MDTTHRSQRDSASSRGTWRGSLLATSLLGGVHELEHIVQVIQRYVLGDPRGSGMLGSVIDIEPVQLAYDVSYQFLLTGVVVVIHRERNVPTMQAVHLCDALDLRSGHV